MSDTLNDAHQNDPVPDPAVSYTDKVILEKGNLGISRYPRESILVLLLRFDVYVGSRSPRPCNFSSRGAYVATRRSPQRLSVAERVHVHYCLRVLRTPSVLWISRLLGITSARRAELHECRRR